MERSLGGKVSLPYMVEVLELQSQGMSWRPKASVSKFILLEHEIVRCLSAGFF